MYLLPAILGGANGDCFAGGVGSLFIQDAEAKCLKLIEGFVRICYFQMLCAPKSSNENFPTKTGREALSLLCCLGQSLYSMCLD